MATLPAALGRQRRRGSLLAAEEGLRTPAPLAPCCSAAQKASGMLYPPPNVPIFTKGSVILQGRSALGHLIASSASSGDPSVCLSGALTIKYVFQKEQYYFSLAGTSSFPLGSSRPDPAGVGYEEGSFKMRLCL